MLALGYYRVSTKRQADEGVNLELEPDAIRRWCLEHDHTLVDIITDANVSGGKPLARRKGGAELIRRARAGEAQLVVTTYLDRLFRDALDGLECMRRTFPRAKLRVLCICDALDLSTPPGRFNATTRLALAEYERDLDCDRSARTNRHLREAGRVYGAVPYGCMADATGRLYREPTTWANRERIVAWARQRIGLRTIAAMLRDLRIRAPKGGLQWSTSTLSELVAAHESLLHLTPMPQEIAAARAEST